MQAVSAGGGFGQPCGAWLRTSQTRVCLAAEMSSNEPPKAYDPSLTERKWYAFWEEQQLFRAPNDASDVRPTYVISMPPPNVTGSLHMGHACRTTFEDVLIRYHRMRGFNALWVPGTDHAGIATQRSGSIVNLVRDQSAEAPMVRFCSRMRSPD